MDEIQIKIAEYRVERSPARLITLGLGSCVGITFFDNKLKVGGMAHIMLPDSSQFTKGNNNIGKFADLAIPAMLRDIGKLGVKRENITAKIAGGAQMFSNINEKSILDIGRRNIEAVKESLKSLGIKLTAEEVGGSKGRTIILDLSTGQVTIRTLGSPLKII